MLNQCLAWTLDRPVHARRAQHAPRKRRFPRTQIPLQRDDHAAGHRGRERRADTRRCRGIGQMQRQRTERLMYASAHVD
jgi:hypothetical protein